MNSEWCVRMCLWHQFASHDNNVNNDDDGDEDDDAGFVLWKAFSFYSCLPYHRLPFMKLIEQKIRFYSVARWPMQLYTFTTSIYIDTKSNIYFRLNRHNQMNEMYSVMWCDGRDGIGNGRPDEATEFIHFRFTEYFLFHFHFTSLHLASPFTCVAIHSSCYDVMWRQKAYSVSLALQTI